MNYIFQDRQWLSPDVVATTLSWSSLQNEGVPPLPHVLWHHEALTVAFLATEDSLPQVMQRMCFVQKQVSVVQVHLVVFCSTDRPLYEGAAFQKKAPWAWIEVAKLGRPFSGVGGTFCYGWHQRTTSAHYSLKTALKPLVKMRPLLAPGTAPAGLFVLVRPHAELWVVALPTR